MSGMQFLDSGSDDPNVIAMKTSGKLTGEDMAALIEKLEQIKGAGGKARIFVDLADYGGYDFGVVKEKMSHFSTFWNSIDRVAYVVDKAWMSSAIGLVDAITPMHIRAFGTDESEQAREWLLS